MVNGECAFDFRFCRALIAYACNAVCSFCFDMELTRFVYAVMRWLCCFLDRPFFVFGSREWVHPFRGIRV